MGTAHSSGGGVSLLVKQLGRVKQPYLPALDSKRSLVKCLQHSPVSLVSIDPKLGEALLRFWADACQEAQKPIFLSIPAGNKPSNQPWRQLQRLIDWIAALVLLAISKSSHAGIDGINAGLLTRIAFLS